MARAAPQRGRVLAKYVLLQVPGWCIVGLALAGLARWEKLAPGTALVLFALWVAKDFLLYPLVRGAYGPGPGASATPALGARAVAEQGLAPDGWVRLGAELWRAELRGGSGRVAPRSVVRVVAVIGMTLIVDPEPARRDAGEASHDARASSHEPPE